LASLIFSLPIDPLIQFADSRRSTMRRLFFLAILAVPLGAAPGPAAASTQSQIFVVLQPKELPAVARAESQSMQLHSTLDGTTYLYIEQFQMRRIVVLDVTNPDRIRALASVAVELPAVFDFAGEVNNQTVLLRLRDGKGVAMLDVRRPGQPKVVVAHELYASAALEGPGKGVFVKRSPAAGAVEAVHDYQVIDSSDPLKPRLLATVLQVSQKVTDQWTGTTYLMGSAGLTVVHRLDLDYTWQEARWVQE